MSITEAWLLANGISADTLATATSVRPAVALTAAKSRTPKARTEDRGYPLLPPTGKPGPWRVELPGWRPTSLNAFLAMHWAKQSRVKKRTDALIAGACLAAGVVAAKGCRRVSLEIGYPSGRYADLDNILKCVYDSLVDAGALVDDSPEWLEPGEYRPFRGPKGTTIVIEEMDDEHSKGRS